jgi:hypothetical protein
MIIEHFDLLCAGVGPAKAHPELIVDADRMLPGAVARQGFETISWRAAEIVEFFGGVVQNKIGDLKMAIEAQHGGSAARVESAPVKTGCTSCGKAWSRSPTLKATPGPTRAYAWTSPIEESHKRRLYDLRSLTSDALQ